MNHSNIFKFLIIILFIISILIVFIKVPFHIVFTFKIVNEDIKINLNLRYMFNIININIPIYPTKKKSMKKELKKTKRKNIFIKKLKEKQIPIKYFLEIYKLFKNIEIEDCYSDIYRGNTNIAITNFAYLSVNLIYGNLINIINPNRFYMNIKPNFIENKIYIDFKLYIKPSIKNIIEILKFILNKNIKEEDKKYESNRINTKYNGNHT